MAHKPAWFRDDQVFVSYAETVGINKDGETLFVIDESTGKRSETIDDRVAEDVDALLSDRAPNTGRWIPADQFTVAVPNYYDRRQADALNELLRRPGYEGMRTRTLRELIDDELVEFRVGHGSPSADMRNGMIPYIKVSDIRAGQVNVNPTNRVSEVVARRFWRGASSGLEPFDLITPVRASKNVGEFAVIMPGQEQVVVTKEVLVLRTTPKAAGLDNFYLMWALTLRAVREQWKRITFMQTNREDVGKRYMEIEIPWPDDAEIGKRASKAFREYYVGMETLRTTFIEALAAEDQHYVFLGSSMGGEAEADVDEVDAESEESALT